MKSLSELRQMVDDAAPRDSDPVHVAHRRMADAFIMLAQEMLERIEALDGALASPVVHHRGPPRFVVVAQGGGGGDTTRSYGPLPTRCYYCGKAEHAGACR